MSAIPVSVVVVSRHRPRDLARCIAGLAQSDHRALELVVVADPEGMAAAQAAAPGPFKAVGFDAANISVARNLGVAAAAGAVVSFIDDDAVPEPTWAGRLAGAFTDPVVAAAGGFVRGRNGISFQWKARTVDRTGQAQALDVDPVTVSHHTGTMTRAIKTEGTNMAFRRSVLAGIGGFDPAFRFYLEETELNLRLAAMGCTTAIVPMAQVHHAFAASARRRADRVPVTLFEIGASSMVLWRKHSPQDGIPAALSLVRDEQRKRALCLMRDGLLEPRGVGALLQTLEDGIAEGAARTLAALPPIADAPAPFLPLAGCGPRRGRVLAGRSFAMREIAAAALMARQAGEVVTLFRFSRTAAYHRMQFRGDGIWQQTGGIWGRSDREARLFQPQSMASRTAAECARLASVRPVAETDC